MVGVRRSAIVNTASVAGMIPEPGLGSYIAAKRGVIGLTKTAGLDYASRGVRINAVAPGCVRTPMTIAMEDNPGSYSFLEAGALMGRPASPEEITCMVLLLCSDAASCVTGQTFVVDGGQTMRGLFPQLP